MEASIGASGATDELAEVRLLSSFVPALMLKAMAHNNAAIEPPMTQDYEAVALFAVRLVSQREPASICPGALDDGGAWLARTPCMHASRTPRR